MRGAAGLLGAALLAYAWLGPLPEMSAQSFAAHMTLHVIVVAVAPPLLAIGLSARRLRLRLPRWAVLLPVPASIMELVVVWGWHTPALHRAARESASYFVLEQLSFLAVGLLVWLTVFLEQQEPGGLRQAASGAAGLILTSMHMTLLGAALALGTLPFYGDFGGAHAGHQMGDAAVYYGLSLSLLEDQHLGGAIMLAVGGASYLIGGLCLVGRLLGLGVSTQDDREMG